MESCLHYKYNVLKVIPARTIYPEAERAQQKDMNRVFLMKNIAAGTHSANNRLLNIEIILPKRCLNTIINGEIIRL